MVIFGTKDTVLQIKKSSRKKALLNLKKAPALDKAFDIA